MHVDPHPIPPIKGKIYDQSEKYCVKINYVEIRGRRSRTFMNLKLTF